MALEQPAQDSCCAARDRVRDALGEGIAGMSDQWCAFCGIIVGCKDTNIGTKLLTLP